MRIAIVAGYKAVNQDNAEFMRLCSALEKAGHSMTLLGRTDDIPPAAELVLSLGGDGTFLRAGRLAARAGVPILGVNFGHLGFLSENTVDGAVKALETGDFTISERAVLKAVTSSGEQYYALNEIVARRNGTAMLGVKVKIGERELPTYWGDGLIIATASGSTAYNLSVGGPIVMPSSKVLIISPIAPHNLNVRPLVVPDDRKVSMQFLSRDAQVCMGADNQSVLISRDSSIEVSMAQFSLKRVCLGDNSFIKALSDKLLWGEDKRNER